MDAIHIAIVGHVDHGKSTLIGRLLHDAGSLPESILKGLEEDMATPGAEIDFAFLMDHLEEERRKGITIDTAQVFFKSKKRRYVIIDTPGHKEFLKNTITGCSQAEAAVLLVDAVEGMRDQTRRHTCILSLLGVKHIIVAINKMDLVDWSEESFHDFSGQVDALFRELGIEAEVLVIPVSAKQGENITAPPKKMPWYQGPSLIEALDRLTLSPPVEKELRFPVQGEMEVDGEKVIMGRIESGRLQVGETLKILPEGRSVLVKDVRRFGEEGRRFYEAGECVGLTLEGNIGVPRGGVLVANEGGAKATSTLRATIFWMAEKSGGKGEDFLFRCATQEVHGKIAKVFKKFDPGLWETKENPGEGCRILHGEVAEVEIELTRPVALDPFHEIPAMGRFVLESGKRPFAGGIVN